MNLSVLGVCLFTTLNLLPPSAAAHPDRPGEARAESPAAAADFLQESLAGREGWRRVEAQDGRWVLYLHVDKKRSTEAIDLLVRGHERLDQVLGAPQQQATDQPVVLVYNDHRDAQATVLDELARQWPHLASWAQSIKAFPKFLHWNPLIGLLRHDRSTAGVKRPEADLVQFAVHLELVRRYGSVPFWIGEALGYGLQEELLGGVYGVSNRRELVDLSEDYHQGWRLAAKNALALEGTLHLAQVAGTRSSDFLDEQAYQRFAVAVWWLSGQDQSGSLGSLGTFLDALAAERGLGFPLDQDYAADTQTQESLYQEAFGDQAWSEVEDFWQKTATRGGPDGISLQVLAAVQGVVDEFKIKDYASRPVSLDLYSDFRSKDAKQALKKTETVLKRLEKSLGKAQYGDLRIQALMLRGEEAYYALCDAIAVADPSLADYMASCKTQRAGFTLPRQAVTVYFYDTKYVEEARPAHSLAHNVIHKELQLRFGTLPLWLTEGIACAGEEGAFGEVWANWYRDGFVATVSHAGWRNRASNLVKRQSVDLEDLYAYNATRYNDELAHLAYAFATYGLDKDSKGFSRFLSRLVDIYHEEGTPGQRFLPPVSTVEIAALESFGEDFEDRFTRYWSRPPKRSR
ncbi:MAG: hypothetical protein DWQ01_13600 [Planctomycetota bacterium]|nr:MAG: hypothetical protein DWQ01_13600 [Planctomycetota bacterium]